MSFFIEKILYEANLENDYAAYQKANEFLKKAKELIAQFPNKFVSYNPDMDFSKVKVGEMIFQLCGQNNKMTAQYKGKFNAAYDRSSNVLSVFNVDISYDKQTKKLSVQFPNENEVIHELVHFIDLKRSGKKQQDIYGKRVSPKFSNEYLQWAKEKGYNDIDNTYTQTAYGIVTGQSPFQNRDFKDYVNDPYELNAHFTEYVIPQINKYVSKETELPTTFEEFKNELFENILSTKYFKDYYNSLTEINRKKFLKRIGVYYQQLKTFVAKDQNVDFNNKDTTSLHIDPPVLSKFFQKIKSVFSVNQSKAA